MRPWQRLVSTRLASSTKGNDGLATLVLLRHGQSTWNAIPTFTGWCDAPLTERGIAEAKASGRLLRERNYTNFDVAFTSTLERAIVTCELTLKNAESTGTPVHKAWQLNERHYGALQGYQKDDPKVEQMHGKELLASWRRDFHATPPAMDVTHPHYRPPPAPLTESLKDCQDRVLNFWQQSIFPTLAPNSTVLLAAHSNTLRALVAYLDQVPIENIPHIHIPNSVPFVFHIDPDGGQAVSPMLDSAAGGTRGQWMFSAENHERLRGKVGGSGGFIRSIFEGWDLNGNGILSLDEIQKGLKELIGGDDIAISALAGKFLEEMDGDDSQTVDLDEFETHATVACQKFMPELLQETNE
mmetsp:Transcript_272/g.647  ORF Transcript_272/g.647 Transcript_272/m.647 type:complete len:355 (-) Transcript_272:29-1093(-)